MLPSAEQPPLTQPNPTDSGTSNLLTIAQLVTSGLGMVISFLAAVGLAVLGLMGLGDRSASSAETDLLISIAWISILVGLLAVPSIVLSARRLWRKNTSAPTIWGGGFKLASGGLVIWALVLALGQLIASQKLATWLFLPPLQLLAIGLPVWWLYEFARRNIAVGSSQRVWGLLNFGIFITMPALMLIEIIVFIGLLIAFGIWGSSNPAIAESIQRLTEQLSASQGDPQAVLQIISPYLRSPMLIFTVLGILAGLIPMIEELFKPLALWALAGRNLTPAEGFVAGALSGAAFALVESLFYLSNPMGTSWAALALGRAGTCLLHITSTALVGWALALAWRGGSYVRLGATYLLASALHGLWNGLSIVTGFGAALRPAPANLRLFVDVARAAPFGLAALVVLMIFLLWNSNRRLIQETRTAALDAAAPLPHP